jgi:hypothetical protein
MAGALLWGMGSRPAHPEAAAASAIRPGGALAVSPSPAPPSLPPGIPPPGVRQPVVGGLGVLAILVSAAAGFFIYRQIRRGL